jgi:hypothetical protein
VLEAAGSAQVLLKCSIVRHATGAEQQQAVGPSMIAGSRSGSSSQQEASYFWRQCHAAEAAAVPFAAPSGSFAGGGSSSSSSTCNSAGLFGNSSSVDAEQQAGEFAFRS